MDNKQQAALDSFNRVNELSTNVKYANIFAEIEGFTDEQKKLQDDIKIMMNSGVVQTGKDNANETTVESRKQQWQTW